MRMRLTLWNTVALALFLTLFGAVAWFTLRKVLDGRGDAMVRESARAIAGAVVAERNAANARGDTLRVSPTAANAVLRELRHGNVDVWIVDGSARVLASPTVPENPDALVLPPPLRDLVARTPGDGNVRVQHIMMDNMPWRAALIRVPASDVTADLSSLVVSVLRSDEEDLAILSNVRTTLLLAIPFALILTVLAGYTLARRSLAPLEHMADSAARISAATLSERLPIGNPHDELGRLASVINALLGRVDTAFRTQRQFVADASHELRTPIAIVRGEADVTLQRATRSESEYRETLEIIRDESVRLTRIVDDLFLLARADASSPLDQHVQCDMVDILTGALRAVRTIADEQRIQLQWRNNTGAAEVFVHGDHALLHRLLLNLLDNALKHTPTDGAITLALSATPDTVVVDVTDSGPGIPESLRPRIFERFIRHVHHADTSSLKPAEPMRVAMKSGAGLGLAIAQAIAHAHHGTISLVDSSPGASFRVELPRA
jgi:heavy metal sensor kinase